jgi:hypothetical protein
VRVVVMTSEVVARTARPVAMIGAIATVTGKARRKGEARKAGARGRSWIRLWMPMATRTLTPRR